MKDRELKESLIDSFKRNDAEISCYIQRILCREYLEMWRKDNMMEPSAESCDGTSVVCCHSPFDDGNGHIGRAKKRILKKEEGGGRITSYRIGS